MDNEYLTCIVAEEHAGTRLDKYLALSLPDLTRQRLQQLIKDRQVIRNNQPLEQPSFKVKAGDSYQIHIPPPADIDIHAESIPLDIIYEDEHLLVINKAAGMVVHPAAGHLSGTLVNALLYHCRDSLSGIGGALRPGIVHRLDKDTSGLMLVAKHDKAHQSLAAQLQDRSLSRIYHAWIWGAMQPPEGTINMPLGRSSHNRKKMAVTPQGKHAVTHYRTLSLYMTPHSDRTPSRPYATKLECRLETGRTHQIRVHCCDTGHALIGDPVYGAHTNKRLSSLPSSMPETTRDIILETNRQALHATTICFIHPESGASMQFHAPYPPDIMRLESGLEAC